MTLIELKNKGAFEGAILMVVAGAAFAAANTSVQYAGMIQGVPPATTAFWQYLIATIAILPLVLKGAWRTGNLVLHLGRVLAAAIGVQLWVAGLAHVPIWQAIALILSAPIFVTIGAAICLKERLTLARAAAVVVGAIGGTLILTPWSEAFSLYALLPIGAAAFWALASLLTKHLSKTENAQTLTTLLLLLLLPINAGFALSSGFAIASPAILTVVLAGACTALAQWALARAYVVADAAFLQPFDHLKLPLNVGLGIMVFGFAPPGSMWLGAALMLAASIWVLKVD